MHQCGVRRSESRWTLYLTYRPRGHSLMDETFSWDFQDHHDAQQIYHETEAIQRNGTLQGGTVDILVRQHLIYGPANTEWIATRKTQVAWHCRLVDRVFGTRRKRVQGVLSRVYPTVMRTPCRKTPQYSKRFHSYAEGPDTEHPTAQRLGCAALEPAQSKVQLLGFPSGSTLLRCRPPLNLPSPSMNAKKPMLTTQ